MDERALAAMTARNDAFTASAAKALLDATRAADRLGDRIRCRIATLEPGLARQGGAR